jgi:hypothetical protein
MRILTVGDTHGVMRWLRESVIEAALDLRCREVMQVGDFGFVWSNSIDTARRVLNEVSSHEIAAGLMLRFLPGNHENHPTLERLAASAERTTEGHYRLAPRVYYTGRISQWAWGSHRLAAVGGATSIDRWDRVPGVSWWPEEELTEEEVLTAQQLGPVDVLFSHDGPPGIPLPYLVPDLPSDIHRERMARVGAALQPRLWLHGHYHASVHYSFRHAAGLAAVHCLDCNGSPNQDSMEVLDLDQLA